MNVAEPEPPADVVAVRADWRRWFLVCQTAHYVIGGAGTFGALLLARPTAALEPYTSGLAMAVAACTAAMAFSKTSEKAWAFLTAWRLLGKASDDFRSGRIDAAALRDEKNKCELDILGKKVL